MNNIIDKNDRNGILDEAYIFDSYHNVKKRERGSNYSFDYNFPNTLKIKDMQIVRIEPGCFRKFNELRMIYLECNVEELLENTFEGLDEITDIILSNNKNLVNIRPGCFEGCKKLIHLDLSNCNLKILFENTFKELKIRRINFSNNNNLVNIEPKCFIGCDCLGSIDLSECNLQLINNNFYVEYRYLNKYSFSIILNNNKLLYIYNLGKYGVGVFSKQNIRDNYLGNEDSIFFNIIRSDTSNISHYNFCIARYNINYRENFGDFILKISNINNVIFKENIIIIFFILMYHVLNINIFINRISLRENIIIFLESYLDILNIKSLNKSPLFSNNIKNIIKNYMGSDTDILNYNKIILKIIHKLVNLYKYTPYFEYMVSLYLNIKNYDIENHIFKKREYNKYFKRYSPNIEYKLYLSSLIFDISHDLTIPKNISSEDINLLCYFVEELVYIDKTNGLKTIIDTIKNIKENLRHSLNSIYENNNKIKIIIDYFNNLSDIFIRKMILNDEKLDFKITTKKDLLSLISLIHKDFRIPKNISSIDINLLYYYVQELLDIKKINKIENLQEIIIPKIILIKDKLVESLNSIHTKNNNKGRIIDYFDDISNIFIRKIIPKNNKIRPKIMNI